MNLNQTQLNWLAERHFDRKDVLEDEKGFYVVLTYSVDGSKSKLYLP